MAQRKKEQGFEDVSSYSSSKEYKSRKKNRRGRLALQCVAAVVCVLLILLGSGMIYISTDIIAELIVSVIGELHRLSGCADEMRSSEITREIGF